MAYNDVIMKRTTAGMQKLFAVSTYTRALEGDFTGKKRVSASMRDVSNHVIQVDAALRGILASLRDMRAICVISANSDASPEEMAERSRELDSLRENITRLSGQVAGTEFSMSLASAGDSGDELRRIDESIDKISKICEPRGVPDDAKLSEWMRSVLGN
jgi:hypothetical protein